LVFAGALATMFVAAAEYRTAKLELIPIKIRRR